MVLDEGPKSELLSVIGQLTPAELRTYAILLNTVQREPCDPFWSSAFIVADLSRTLFKRHGRFRNHLRSISAKQMIVPLNPSRAHQQRYLLGCVFNGSEFYAAWVREMLAQFVRVDIAALSDGFRYHGSSRVMRPASAETPESLKNKGFRPFVPGSPSLYKHAHDHIPPNLNDSWPVALRPLLRAVPMENKRKVEGTSITRKRQVSALAYKLAGLTDTPVRDRGRDAVIWRTLLSDYGFERLIAITEEAWTRRREVLTEQYPCFTVFSVQFFARFRMKSHIKRTIADEATANITQLITESYGNDGRIDRERLRRTLLMHGVQNDTKVRLILQEFDVDPALVFGM